MKLKLILLLLFSLILSAQDSQLKKSKADTAYLTINKPAQKLHATKDLLLCWLTEVQSAYVLLSSTIRQT